MRISSSRASLTTVLRGSMSMRASSAWCISFHRLIYPLAVTHARFFFLRSFSQIEVQQSFASLLAIVKATAEGGGALLAFASGFVTPAGVSPGSGDTVLCFVIRLVK